MSTVGNYRGPSIVKDGLVLYLDAATANSYNRYISPATLKDISGNGNNGTLTNGPTFNSANGGSIVFDGLDDFVNLGNNSLDSVISGINNFTISCWVYKTNENGVILSAWDTTPNRKIYIGFISDIVRVVGSSDGSDFFIADGNVLTNNSWYNIVVTRLGSSGNSGISIYVNNTLQPLSFTGIFTSIISNSTNYRLGNRQDIINNAFPLNGRISNTQVYNRALSATEVLQNYNATRARFGI